MKKAVIIHCWEGYPEYCWYQSTKKELEQRGFEVDVPAFPETKLPKLDRWLQKLEEVVGKPNEDVFLIGHSLGCITILRYLETLNVGEKIGGAVLVAGYTDDLGFDELKNFFTKSVHFEKIKQASLGFIAIHSDNDPYVPLKHGDIFKKELGAELIVKNKAKHFSGAIGAKGSCEELPDVVSGIERLSAKQ